MAQGQGFVLRSASWRDGGDGSGFMVCNSTVTSLFGASGLPTSSIRALAPNAAWYDSCGRSTVSSWFKSDGWGLNSTGEEMTSLISLFDFQKKRARIDRRQGLVVPKQMNRSSDGVTPGMNCGNDFWAFSAERSGDDRRATSFRAFLEFMVNKTMAISKILLERQPLILYLHYAQISYP